MVIAGVSRSIEKILGGFRSELSVAALSSLEDQRGGRVQTSDAGMPSWILA